MKELNQSITVVKGVGEETAIQLQQMGIFTVLDLLEYFPYRYEDYQLKDLADVNHEERVTVEGEVHSEPSLRYFGKKKSRMSVRVLIGRYLVTAIFFNQAYLKNKITLGETVTITGKWDQHRQQITVSEAKAGKVQRKNNFEPVYGVKGKMTPKVLRKIIHQALKEFGAFIPETLPDRMRVEYKLIPKKDAVYQMHFPLSQSHVKHARRRLVYEEFLFFQLKMQAFRKFEREQTKGINQVFDEQKVEQFIHSLPFPLTGAQRRVVNEILTDLKNPHRMNRLLQGDVGSGKTVVAAIGLFASVTAGFQGALMVPTEILAEQHVESLKGILGPEGICVELLTSSVKGKKRKELLGRLQEGEVNILVGTHALIQDEIHFKNLGLVITDEQHRFGVAQRRTLREKGENPDVLFMTATPIPRTLAISVFGDMDVSIIDEMPAGRKVIETYWAKHDMLDRVLNFMQKELEQGRQAYVICPLIEESDKLDVQNAIDVHSVLHHHFINRWKVGLMHGRLTSDEKDQVMRSFSENEVQVLVSTTVVEVGVNVPNATFMLIYDAERFGLSQLHQLRGRVGRGSNQSYCILLADPKSDVGKERMTIMTETNDGFELSQRDLELRGPGDFFGRKQSGVPEFKVADMVHDYRALEVARTDALQLIENPSFWNDEMYKPLRKTLQDSGVIKGDKLD